jgi:hypothetical protein
MSTFAIPSPKAAASALPLVPPALITKLLFSWDFLSRFSRVLTLTSFALDALRSALAVGGTNNLLAEVSEVRVYDLLHLCCMV